MLNSSNGTTHTYLLENHLNKQSLDKPLEVVNLVASNTQKHKGYFTGEVTCITQFKTDSKVVGFSSLNELFEYELKSSRDQHLDEEELEIRKQVKYSKCHALKTTGFKKVTLNV